MNGWCVGNFYGCALTKSLKPMLPGSIIIVKIYIFSESSFDGLSIDIYLAVSCSTEKLHPGVLFGFRVGCAF